MCVLERSSPLLTVSWAVPLTFELLVLAMTCWNAVDRPREAAMPLPRVLRKDGIIFFIVCQPKSPLRMDADQVAMSQVMTLLRATNLGVVATERPALVLLTSLYVFILALLHPLRYSVPAASSGPWRRSRSTEACSRSAALNSRPRRCPCHRSRCRARPAASRRRRDR
jgi:hypothetical protein